MSDTPSDPPLPRQRKPQRFVSGRIIFALVIREMTTAFGRSPGGYLWAILEPVAAITLLAYVFSLAFRGPPMGISFALFYASGYLPFMLFNDLAMKMALAIRFNKQLLFYPRVTYIDALAARFALNFLTHTLVFYIVMCGILVLQDTQTFVRIRYVFEAFAMVAALSFAIGVLNCFLFEIIPAWQRIWNVLTRPLFILSGVLFPIEAAPGYIQPILMLNPVAHVVSHMRRGFYPYYDAVLVSQIYVYTISIIAAGAGMFLLARYNRTILDI
ncbi:MAG: ABC transporter permease [Gammaproteobacteria bacterium]|nr:ABC transporter permease [Gammaproteobacteria bacterium]